MKTRVEKQGKTGGKFTCTHKKIRSNKILNSVSIHNLLGYIPIKERDTQALTMFRKKQTNKKTRASVFPHLTVGWGRVARWRIILRPEEV